MHSFSRRSLLIVLSGGTLALVCGVLIGKALPDTHDCIGDYQFVNSDVVCGEVDVIRKTGYVETRSTILAQIESAKSHGVENVAVYFRDLERGPVFGINELDAFAPASLLKLPLAFVFMSAAEDQPAVLAHSLTYNGETSVAGQRTAPRESAQNGEEYTIEELLRMMLAYSDNASYEVLEGFLNKEPQRMQLRHDAFQELGLIDPKDRVETTISVRGYASLFRILYNASYLNVEHSERVLRWLSESDYMPGLVAGVPEGVVVAHKFGERFREDGTKELHDCGIVYVPGNPYLLCVMTRGSDWAAQEELIGTISRTVYEEVESRRL